MSSSPGYMHENNMDYDDSFYATRCDDLDDSQYGNNIDQNAAFDNAIRALKNYRDIYDQRAKENLDILQKLGCSMDTIPDDIRKELNEVFSDNEVFNFSSVGSKEMVMINPVHVLDSLQTDNQLSDLQGHKIRLNAFVDELQHMQDNLQRKLEIARAQANFLDEQATEKSVQEMLIRGKLEKVQSELKSLQELSNVMEKPKYSMEEINRLHREVTSLKEEVALAKAKLEKYHSLSLNENEATGQLAKLKDELKNIDAEIKKQSKLFNY